MGASDVITVSDDDIEHVCFRQASIDDVELAHGKKSEPFFAFFGLFDDELGCCQPAKAVHDENPSRRLHYCALGVSILSETRLEQLKMTERRY